MTCEEKLRRILVLASYGMNMDFFYKYVDDPEFLTIPWLENLFGEELPPYMKKELELVA